MIVPVSNLENLKARARLSPSHLNWLLTGDWRTIGPFRLNQHLTADDLTASVAFVNGRRVLQTVQRDGGVPVGPHGLFAKEYRLSLAQELWWGLSGEPPPPDEQLYDQTRRPIELTQRALEVADLLHRSGELVHVTKKGQRLLNRESGGELFATLFRTYFADLDHSLIDHEPAIPNAWAYVPYAIYVIGYMTDRWYDIDTVLQSIIPTDVARAENAQLRSFERRDRITPTVHELFLMRFLDLLPDFGLLATQPTEKGETGFPYPRFRRGPLYDRVVTFVWHHA